MAHCFNQAILREYDINGTVSETLSARDATALGAAFGTMVSRVGGRSVVLGMDGKLSSPMLATSLASGLISTGMTVLRIEPGPTPMVYFADRHLGSDAAITVTGSNLPHESNGFKMVIGGNALYGNDIQELGLIARHGAFATGSGKLVDCQVAPAYLKRLLADVDMVRPLNVVWDIGHGATGEILSELCAQLPRSTHLTKYKGRRSPPRSPRRPHGAGHACPAPTDSHHTSLRSGHCF